MHTSLRLCSKLTAFSLALAVVGCTAPEGNLAQNAGGQSPSEASTEGIPQVVASYSVLCDLTEQIAQTTVGVTCLIGAGQDPHTYSATPADRRAIEEADLVLYGGYEFEPEIIKMVEATDLSVPAVAVSEAAVSAPLLGKPHDHGEEDHAEGEEHEGHEDHEEGEMEADPHVWHDAENGVAMVREIQRQLSEVSPENVALYETNADALVAQLEQLDTWIQTQVDTVPATSRTLISTHDALSYYAAAYGIEMEAALDSFSTEARPSAENIKALVDVVAEKNVSSIFVESTSNPGLIETVSRETEIAVSEDPIYADGLGEADTPAASYQGMLVTNTCTIVNGLGGTCDQAAAQALLAI